VKSELNTSEKLQTGAEDCIASKMAQADMLIVRGQSWWHKPKHCWQQDQQHGRKGSE